MLGVSLPLWVKVAVQVSASTWLKLLRLPPATLTSPSSKPLTASLNWKVMVVLSPAARLLSAALMTERERGGEGEGVDGRDGAPAARRRPPPPPHPPPPPAGKRGGGGGFFPRAARLLSAALM